MPPKPDPSAPIVRRVVITREPVDFAHPTAGAELAAALAALAPGAGPAAALPLARERVLVELDGVPTAVANALRRTLKDELRGRCLTFDGPDLDREGTTDPFMADEDFVRTRVRMIPLRPQVAEAVVAGLRLALDVENPSETVMAVYSGDLVVTQGELAEPLFNPTHELAFLQPGRSLRIRNIRLAEGYGLQDAAFMVAARAAARPLDLAEAPRADTHGPGGPAAEQSGYAASAFVADPRRHEVTAVLPAVPDDGGASTATVLIDACGSVMQRLRFLQGVLEGAAARRAAPGAAAYFLVTPDGPRTKGVLGVRNDPDAGYGLAAQTDTIGNLVARAVHELVPDVSFVGYTCVPHENALKITVAHAVAEPGEVGAILARAVAHAYGVFSRIQQEIRRETR